MSVCCVFVYVCGSAIVVTVWHTYRNARARARVHTFRMRVALLIAPRFWTAMSSIPISDEDISTICCPVAIEEDPCASREHNLDEFIIYLTYDSARWCVDDRDVIVIRSPDWARIQIWFYYGISDVHKDTFSGRIDDWFGCKCRWNLVNMRDSLAISGNNVQRNADLYEHNLSTFNAMNMHTQNDSTDRIFPIAIQTLWMQYAQTMALFSQKHRSRCSLWAWWRICGRRARSTPSDFKHVGLWGDVCMLIVRGHVGKWSLSGNDTLCVPKINETHAMTLNDAVICVVFIEQRIYAGLFSGSAQEMPPNTSCATLCELWLYYPRAWLLQIYSRPLWRRPHQHTCNPERVMQAQTHVHNKRQVQLEEIRFSRSELSGSLTLSAPERYARIDNDDAKTICERMVNTCAPHASIMTVLCGWGD